MNIENILNNISHLCFLSYYLSSTEMATERETPQSKIEKIYFRIY